MPLVSSKELLEYAREAHFAVGAFNADNLEMVQAIVETAQEERAAKERVREKIRLFGSNDRISRSGAFRSPPTQRRSVELGSPEE